MHSTAVTVAPMIARTELAHGRYTLLHFERGPQTRQRRPWYTSAVTATLASQIRQLAAERGYDKLKPDAQRVMRREIADELGTKIQNVVNAIDRGKAPMGRPRTAPRCPTCGHRLTAEEARQMAKKTKKRK